METKNRDGGMDRRVMDNIRFNARRLARAHTIRGMDVEDYEQDLVADLLHRKRAFDPSLASFATFADRIVGHRISTLTRPTLHLRQERSLLSLDALAQDQDGNEQALIDLLPDGAPPLDESAFLRIDIGRFVEELPPPLVDCCEVLLADSISAGARAAGIHRSTAYERAGRLRERALAHGLAIYVTGSLDTFARPPVDDGGQVGPTPLASDSDNEGAHAMGAGRKFPTACLRLSEMDLCAWLAQANPGDRLEYYRGFLSMDRCPVNGQMNPDVAELLRVARRAMSAAESGLAHLVQRKNGPCDYSYVIIAKPKPARTEVTRTTIHWEA